MHDQTCVCFSSGCETRDTSTWLSAIFDDESMDDYNRRLAVGAVIAEEMRAAVYSETGFRCSAGIAHNKVSWGVKPAMGSSTEV